MKKNLIIGATECLAQHVIEAAKNVKNVQLSLLVRNKSRLSNDTVAGYKVIEGDALNYRC